MDIRSVSRRTSLNVGSPAGTRSRSAERPMKGVYSDFDFESSNAKGNGSFDNSSPTTSEQMAIGGGSNSSNNNRNHSHSHSHLSVSSHGHNRERLSSESSISKQVRSHRRAMSDPFDTAESGGITDGDLHHLHHNNDNQNGEEEQPVKDYGLLEEEDHALPTLVRFPFAETNDKNCWSETPVDIFSVRGADYLADKRKVPAQNYLLRARGCDLFLADNPNQCKMSKLKGALGGKLRKQPSLLIRLTFPWGILIQYYEVPPKLAPFMRNLSSESSSLCMDGFSPAEQTLAKWLQGDSEYKNDRLKLISYVAEGPWIVRNLVTGKPALIGKKLPVKYSYTPCTAGNKQDFLECDLDIGNSSKTAKRIVSVCRRYMSALAVDIGFVIEGKTESELPEEMMGAIRIHEVDPIKAPTVHS